MNGTHLPPQRYAIESGVCCINGKPAKVGTIVKNGDRIENIVHRHEPPVTSIPVKVMHIDREKELIVIDKPGSIVSSPFQLPCESIQFNLFQPVHAVGRYYKNSLVEILQTDFGFEKVYRRKFFIFSCTQLTLCPLAVNRLDRLTSGCMIMALSPIRARQMCDEFLAGGVRKEVCAQVVCRFLCLTSL